MKIDVLSTFPDMFEAVMQSSMMRIAQDKGILSFKAHDLRDWTHDRHRTTDDDPYGGGVGLVMKCGPLFEALDELLAPSVDVEFGSSFAPVDAELGTPSAPGDVALGTLADPAPGDVALGTLADPAPGDVEASGTPSASGDVEACGTPSASGDVEACDSFATRPFASRPFATRPYCVFMSPAGTTFTDEVAARLAEKDSLLFVCGHYEGIDERAFTCADEVVSIGDYVLTSGELAAMVVIDAVVRKLDGVLGSALSAQDESFHEGLLEYPQYTRPSVYRGLAVPEVLLSGNHAQVKAWRRKQALERTWRLRSDLVEKAQALGFLTKDDQEFLDSLLNRTIPGDEAVL